MYSVNDPIIINYFGKKDCDPCDKTMDCLKRIIKITERTYQTICKLITYDAESDYVIANGKEPVREIYANELKYIGMRVVKWLARMGVNDRLMFWRSSTGDLATPTQFKEQEEQVLRDIYGGVAPRPQ